MPEETGVGNASDSGDAGNSGDAGEATQDGGKLEAWKSKAEVAEKALNEQKAVQSGLDKKIDTLSKQVDELKDEKVELQAEVGRLTKLANTDDVEAEFKEQMQSLQEQLDGLKGNLKAKEQEVTTLKQETERLNIVASEFPQMAPLVKAKALPSADDSESFREAMQQLAETFVSKGDVEAHARREGARPPSSPAGGEGATDISKIKANMDAARREGNKKEYEKWREQWFDWHDKKS